jgi:type IV pilus assembly protein PilC
MHSGVTVCDGLLIIADEEKDKDYRRILTESSSAMENGESLSHALSTAGCFPAHAIGLIAVAERVGRLEETLISLAEYYETRERISKSIRNAITYPSILLLMMLVVITVLLSRVLPVFDEVYGSLGGNLTGLAGGLLTLGNMINAALPYIGIVLGIIIMIIAIIALIPCAQLGVKKLYARVFGDVSVAKAVNNAHFAQALAMALASGLPLEEGISLASSMLSDIPSASKRANTCAQLLDSGKSLSDALLETSLLSASSARMLTLGMRAGKEDDTMKDIAARMSDEAEEALEARVSAIEPALVVVTSFMVGAILLSVMLPLINIMQAIG